VNTDPAAADTPAARADHVLLLQRCLLVALAYGLLAQACLAFGGAAARTGVLWLPLGVALAAWLRWGAATLLGVALGGAGLAGAAAHPAPLVPAMVAADIVGVLTCAALLGRAGFDRRLARGGDVGLLLAAGALAAIIGAAIVEGAMALGGLHEPTAWPRAWMFGSAGRWFGLLLAGVPLLVLSRDDVVRALTAQRRGPTLLLLVGLAAAATAAFAPPTGASLLPLVLAGLPAALLAALVVHAGLGLASAAAALLALCVAWSSSVGRGPFAPALTAQLPAPLWAYAAMLAGVVLLVHLLTRHITSVEQRWLMALGGAGLGVGEWQLPDGSGRTSAQWKHLSGSTSTALSAWLDTVHGHDRSALHDILQQLRCGDHNRAQCEIRVPSDGGWRWLDAQLLVVERDRQGRGQRLIATLSDSSQRHDAQEHQRLSSSLFQNVHEGLLIADAELRVLDVNPAYTHILGVSRESLLGRVPSMLDPAAADPLLRQQRQSMWAGLRSTGCWRGEIVERRRNGDACTLQATISTVNNPDGKLLYHAVVISDITEQRQQRDRLERLAHFDELTRLPNRARLMKLLAEAMSAADADGHLLTVCYLDLDHFKPVNDRFGHAAGDQLLVELAGRLRSALRSNAIWSDTAGRLGGDEFVLLLRATTMEESRLAVERVLRVVAQPYLIDADAEPVQVTASMGCCVYPVDRSDADTLLRHADNAMYDAKQAGRNGYQFFDPEHRKRNEERVMAIGRVQQGLDRSEFALYYQPMVDMRRGLVLGLEALLRWDHPQQGLLAPSQFLPVIENTGLSARVGDWVLAKALEHLAMWRRAGLDISVSVNVSPRHLQEPDFTDRLKHWLSRHPQPLAGALELEVLETTAHADIDATSALLADCRRLGVRFALDDFGTGYSTLAHLKQLPVDKLKIDRSFVRHMLDDPQDRAIVEGVVGLARTFQCVVVAEGVESPAQARTLLDLGCNIGQGTGIAAPMPASAVSAWIRDYKGLFALAAAPETPPARAAGNPAA
jgi:diguanylate cyclase (GGDEF)-like protein/PAS domain S-box-containing protein